VVVPTIIELTVLKNTFRDGIFTNTTPLVVDDDAEILIGAVHKEDYKKLLFQISNDGGNSLDFAFYGAGIDDLSHGKDVPFLPPPDYDGTNLLWSVLPNSTGTVPTIDSAAQTITDNWTWVLITVKRTIGGQSTTGNLYVRGE